MGIQHINDYVSQLHEVIERLPLELIDELISVLFNARVNGRQVFIMGNGGSASTATHFAADLSKNTRKEGLPNFRVMGLADNMAIFSAYANDEGYENVFVQQLASFVRPHDIVIGISASGNSANVIKAIELANQVKATTVGFTGFDGGKLGPMVDLHIHVPSSIIEQVEDIHLMIEHMIVKTIKLEMADYASGAQVYPANSEYASAELAALQPATAAEPLNADHMHTRLQSVLDLLNEIDYAPQAEMSLAVTLEKMLSAAVQGVGASSGSLMMLNKDGQVEQAALAYEGAVASYGTEQLSEIASNGLAGWVAANRQPALLQDTDGDPRWLPRPWEKEGGASRSAVSVPLMHQDQVLGVLTLVRSQAEKFTREDLVLLTALAVFVSIKSAQPENR